MGIYLDPGLESFKRAVNSKIYVDKTDLIAYTNALLGTEQGYLCVSRPRRFGKSMTANMLCAYYSKNCDASALFEQFKIASDASYREHMNKYHVIYLNMQHFLNKVDETREIGSAVDVQVVSELKDVYGGVLRQEDRHLSTACSRIFENEENPYRGFVFIIDEWDCIFRELKSDVSAQKEYLDFLRNLLKDRNYVKLAYMTGILPIKKYGTHSALNMFYEYSMTDPKQLAEYVGFTESEVKKLCRVYGLEFEEVQNWYDGYHFRDCEHIYSPKSVVDAMLEGRFKNYWTGTETYEALKVYIEMNFDGLKDSIVHLLGGGACKINARKFQNDMTSFNQKDDVMTLLVHLGYLAYDERTQEVTIPNDEIADEFVSAVEETHWEEVIEALNKSEELLAATLRLDAAAVERILEEIHSETASIWNYNDENALSCTVMIAYYCARREYVLVREFPTGKGFADIVFIPRRHSSSPAMIVELKWDQSADTAIRQIKDRRYEGILKDWGGELLLVGISYDKKSKNHACVIEQS